jgi:hypothetical protein
MRVPENNRYLGILLLITVLLAVLFSSVKLFDQDTFFHLAGGRLVAESGLPSTNSFAFTYPDHPWKHSKWLFDLAVYASFRIGGYNGIELLQVLLVVGIFLVTIRTAVEGFKKIGTGDLLCVIPTLILALSASRIRFPMRPHLISLLGIAVLLCLWTVRPRKTVLWFGLLAVIWANLHPGVVHGAVICSMLVAGSLLSRNREMVGLSIRSSAAFLVGSVINPYTIYPYYLSLAHFTLDKSLPAIIEFRAPNLLNNTSFFLFAILALAVMPWRVKEKDYLYLMLAPFFFLLAMFANRAIPHFTVVTLPGIAATLCGVLRGQAAKPFGRKSILVLLSILTAASLYLSYREAKGNNMVLSAGWGLNQIMLPGPAADFVEESDLSGNMYNDVLNGGYLMWRFYGQRPVFVDGRLFPYPLDFLRRIHGFPEPVTPPRWADLMDEFDIDYAVVRRESFRGASDAGLLFQSLNWPLVFIDGISYVFVRPGSVNEERAGGFKFEIIRPDSTGNELLQAGRQYPERMKSELQRINPDRTLDPGDSIRFGAGALGAKAYQLAGRFLDRGLVLNPKSPLLHLVIGEFFLDRGDVKMAVMEFTEAARLGGDSETARRAEERIRELKKMEIRE